MNCLVCGVEFCVTERVYWYDFISFAETSGSNNDYVYVCEIVKDRIIMNAYALSIVRAACLLSSKSLRGRYVRGRYDYIA